MQETTLRKIFIKAGPPLLVIAAVAILSIFTDTFRKEPVPIVVAPEVKPSEFPDYDAYNKMEKGLVLVSNQESYSPKDKPIIGKVKGNIVVSGRFSRAYLYVEASVDNGLPLSQWDSVYVSLNNKPGHLFRPDTLKLPNSDITKLLYSTNQVPVLSSIPYSENKIPVILDWFSLMQDGEKLPFEAFISSLRPGGKLNLVEIRYECEVDIVCNLSLN